MTDFDHLDTKYVSAFYTNLFNSPARCYLQGNVETHLLCGAIYNNHIIANCLQSVPVKEF